MPRLQTERSDAVLALGYAFRLHGYTGASLTSISGHTGLGKGSLYHFFPGGKADMADAVLTQVSEWFEQEVFAPLRAGAPPAQRLDAMFDAVEDYFGSRHLVCLFAVFAIGQEQQRFAERIRAYFSDWIEALAGALPENLPDRDEVATDVVATIQGALVLARAMDDKELFHTSLTRLRASLPRTP